MAQNPALSHRQISSLSMELTLLLPLLVALQILPRPVLPAGAPAAPSLSLNPQKQEYFPGDTVEIKCSAPPSVDRVEGFQYYSDIGKAISVPASSRRSHTYNINLTGPKDGGSYQCDYWIGQAGSWNRSSRSDAVLIRVKDFPPWPALSVDPPSGVVSEGLPLLITCTAPSNAGERRFHFYKEGAELVPGDVGSEVSTTETRTGSMMLNIPRAGPNSAGEFTCAYEQNMSGRWILSLRSLAVNVTMTAHSHSWVRELAVGGSFFTINGLIFLISHLCLKGKGSKEEHTSGSDPFQSDYYSVLVQLVTGQSGHSATAKANHVSSPMPQSRGSNEYQEEM
ncbi:alpha-1B-glycoprotein-like isoform X1 [Terrapene carolina triunguis]|uniref:alpha-1B-glycoprotein-like isoform X1 n=1 Tax=Terrapene triunguis TaxID=2587831 RepID=UPI000CF00B28|nr:alpha-1B-glycoprotein-like isoform X1 [Terrapene carolina triunguis]